MKILHFLIWISFLGALAIMSAQVIRLKGEGFSTSLSEIEFHPDRGMEVIEQWQQTETARGTTLIDEARRSLRWDLVFIFGYVGVIFLLSYRRMQKEGSLILNELLRFNFVMAIEAGLFDVTENIILLVDMRPWNIGNSFISVYWPGLLKWICAGWAILVWLISLLKSAIRAFSS